MEDMRQDLDWLGSKKVLSMFDLKNAFYSVELEDHSKPLTAIRSVVGLLHYMSVPQGRNNSSVTLQRIINIFLGDRKGQDVFAFIDDTSARTETVEKTLSRLKSLLNKFLQASVSFHLSKCSVSVRITEILGQRVDNEAIWPSEAHIAVISRLVELTSGEELKRSLGLFWISFLTYSVISSRLLHHFIKCWKVVYSPRNEIGEQLRGQISQLSNRHFTIRKFSELL